MEAGEVLFQVDGWIDRHVMAITAIEPHNATEVCAVVPMFHVRPREDRHLAWGHIATGWQSQDLTSDVIYAAYQNTSETETKAFYSVSF